MLSLEKTLKGSQLLGPLVRLAELPSERLNGVFAQSGLTQAAQKLAQWLSLAANPLPFSLLFVGVFFLFGMLTWFDTGPIGAMTWLLGLGSLLVWLTTGWQVFRRLTVIDWLVLAFVLSGLISTAFSSYVATSWVGLGKMITFLVGYGAFRTLLDQQPTGVWKFMAWLVLLGSVESLVGLYQYINHIQPLATWEDPSVNPELKFTRIFGTLKPANPNLLAGFLIPCLAAAGGLSLVNFFKKNWTGALLNTLASGLILVALVLTGSRGGYLAIATMASVGFLYVGHLLWHHPGLVEQRRYKQAWLGLFLVAVTGAVAAVALSPSLQHRLASIFAMREDSSTAYRLNVYASAVRMFLDNLWVGIGPGNGTFKQVYGLYMVPGYNALGAYSVPLEVAVEQGILGLAIFALLWLTFLLRTLLRVDAPISLESKLLLGLLLLGLLGHGVYGLFDTIWYRPSVNLLFWFFVANLALQTEKKMINSQIIYGN